MKKRILAMLLSALLVANISSCLSEPENDDTNTLEHTDTIESIEEIIESQNSESIGYYNSINSSFSPSFIQESGDVYCYSKEGETLLYIPAWEKYFAISNDFNPYLSCATVVGNKAWIFQIPKTNSSDAENTNVLMNTIDNTTGEQKQKTLLLPQNIWGYEPIIFCSMVNESTGWLFAFANNFVQQECYLACIIKTQDGGEHWESVNIDTMPKPMYWKNTPVMAHYFDKNTAIISCHSYFEQDYMEGHTFLTFDGGKTWHPMSHFADLPYPDFDFVFSTDIAGLVHDQEEYILTVRVYNSEPENSRHYIQFRSTDLKTWFLVQ